MESCRTNDFFRHQRIIKSVNRQRLLPRPLASKLVCLLLATSFLGACEQEAAAPEERIRAVKTIVVADLASEQQRKFPGTIEPVDSSQLSFEVDGIVAAIRVDAGDKFKKGDVLANLDNKPFQLNLASAKAALSRSSAQLAEKQSAYEREQRIQAEDPGATTQKAVDQARAAYESQVQEVSYSKAQLGLAARDLSNTELIAPYDGTVAARYIQPSEVAARGARILEVYSESAMQVAVSIPEQMIADVHTGIKGRVFLNNQSDSPYDAVVSEVGSSAKTANAFPVKALISNPDKRLRPGMTAELQLVFADANMKPAYLVPTHAFLPVIKKHEHYVYLLDSQTSTVHKTAVKINGVQGDYIVVTDGISPGDILVVAGVSFLRDGQKVKQMQAADASQ
jgi:membrane fusion protein, multidrug efflux system